MNSSLQVALVPAMQIAVGDALFIALPGFEAAPGAHTIRMALDCS
jgi:hypothetical protein